MSMYGTALSRNNSALSRNNVALSAINSAQAVNDVAINIDGAAPGTNKTIISEQKSAKGISLGAKLTSPAGRLLEVTDIFVPRTNREKSRSLPSQFRNMNRKIVVFHNGTMAPLKEIQSLYKLVA